MTDELEQRLRRLPADAWSPPPALERIPGGAPRRRRSVPRLVVPALAAVAAACIAVVVVLGDGPGGPSERSVPLAAVDAGAAAGEARLGRDLTVDVRDLRPQRSGTYEVWLLNSPKDLRSVGTVTVGSDGRGRATLRLPSDASRYRFVDVSREPADGNPRHSGDSVLRSAPLTRLA